MKKIKIAQWQKGLPEGYDISDDVENDLKEVDYAIKNAKEYKIPKKVYPFRTYGTKRVNLIRETFG